MIREYELLFQGPFINSFLITILGIILFILLLVGVFFGIYYIILLIGRTYDPKSIKEKFNYNTFDPDKFLVNMVMEDCVRALQHNGYTLKEVNINGFQSLALNRKETVYEYGRGTPFEELHRRTGYNKPYNSDVFVIFCERESITKKDITEFSDFSCSYSIKTRKGLPRGLNSGSLTIAILMSENINMDAIWWVKDRPPQHFAAMELPVIYDLTKNQYHHYINDKLWGKGIYPFVYSLLEFLFGKPIPRYRK